MTARSLRSREERALLNPAFCSNLIWHAARGHAGESSGFLSFEESFLVLPLVLHRPTRELLPHSVRTSLAVWLHENPLTRGRMTIRARFLVPFTREALTLAGSYGLIRIERGQVHAEAGWKRAVNRVLAESSDEVKICASRARFIGRWFAKTGDAATVLALIGVRP